jgi:hypothetical protein
MQEEKETTCGLYLILKKNSKSDAMSAQLGKSLRVPRLS